MSPGLIIFLSVLGCFFIWISIKTIISDIDDRKDRQKLLQQMEEPLELPPAEAIGARVIAKYEEIAKGGSSHTPKHFISYCMTFLTDNGETVTYKVSQEIYLRYNEYDTATLVTVDGEFFYFGEGEDVETDNLDE